jgi:hypothetical protein
VPPEVLAQLQTIKDPEALTRLLLVAARSNTLERFRQELPNGTH